MWTGLLAGTVAGLLEMVLLQAAGRGGMWDPVRLSASIALGNQVVTASAPFTFDIFFVGMLVHYVVAIWYAVVLGMIIRKMKPATAVIVGAVFGLLIYLLNFHGLSGLYPWVANSRNWIFCVGHVAFGTAAAWIYSQLRRRQLMHEAGLLPSMTSMQ